LLFRVSFAGSSRAVELFLLWFRCSDMNDAGGSGGGSARPWLEVGLEFGREYDRPLLEACG
jgi:hypothetical protein